MPPSEPTIALYVVRHGRVAENASNSFRGNIDPPLDSVGVAQAHKLASLFSNIEVCAIFTSDKQRATKTAEIISQKNGSKVVQSSALEALNVGQFSGQKRSPENIKVLQHYLDNPDCPIPDGESLNQFRARVDPCLQEALHLFMKFGVPPMIVAHSSVVREVGHLIMGDHKKSLVDPGGAIAVYLQDGQLKVEPIFRPMADKKKTDTIS